MSVKRSHTLSLYRSFLRYGNLLSSYNFREYALRRAKDGFRLHRNETDQRKIQDLISNAQQQLEILKRQSSISQMYEFNPLVVEDAQRKAKALRLAKDAVNSSSPSSQLESANTSRQE